MLQKEEQTIITFANLLEAIGINSNDIQFLRHTPKPNENDITPYAIWLKSLESKDDKRYLRYTAIQKKKRLYKKYIVTFVKTPKTKALFTGIYQNNGIIPFPDNITCPIGGELLSPEGHEYSDLSLTHYLESYIGRLSVNWRGQNPYQINASDKIIEAILDNAENEMSFPGFHEFVCDINKLDTDYPKAWIDTLKNTNGIYILTCKDSGKRYVGSATGNGGFYQRWQGYKNGHHNNNKQMITHETTGYWGTVLEVIYNASTYNEEIEKKEHTWIKKLMSTSSIFGLNTPSKTDDTYDDE